MLINLNKLLLIIFPKKCVGCRAPDFWICESCLNKIPKSKEAVFPWATSVFKYQNPLVRKIVWLIKFNRKHSVLRDIEKTMKESFENFLKNNSLEDKKIILVPIPITKQSKTKRGYNQSTLICRVLAKENKNIEINESILAKSFNHAPQNKIKDRNKRMKNIKNSFKVVSGNYLRDEIIVLIDDVVTTGATIQEAKKTLKNSGFKKIYGFSLAH